MKKNKENSVKTKKNKIAVSAVRQLSSNQIVSNLAEMAGMQHPRLRDDTRRETQEDQIRVLGALRERRKRHGLRPIGSIYDCEGAVQQLAAALSEEPIQFLIRPITGGPKYDYSGDESLKKAEAHVKTNPSASIQFGWLLFDTLAIFHAAIRKSDGELMLVDDNIPGLFFESTIAFLPDYKNKPDPYSCSIPTDVFWIHGPDGECLRIWEKIRCDFDPDSDQCDYADKKAIDMPLSTLIFKAGLAPHEPSPLLDQRFRTSHEEMLEREKRTRSKFREAMRLTHRIDLLVEYF
jgi:hypothetical protein